MKEIIKLEEEAWRALSSADDAARAFFSSVLRDDAIMLFPGGMRLVGKQRILSSLSSQPWQTFHLQDLQTLRMSDSAVLLAYRVSAQREGAEPYRALITSAYAREVGSWKLVLHQHTLF